MIFASTWPSRTGNTSFPPCQVLSARLLFNSWRRPRDTRRAISLATTARVVQSTQANYRNNLLVRAAGKSPMLKASTVMTSICPNQVMSSQPVSHSLVLDLQPPSFGQKFSFELSMKVGLPSAQADRDRGSELPAQRMAPYILLFSSVLSAFFLHIPPAYPTRGIWLLGFSILRDARSHRPTKDPEATRLPTQQRNLSISNPYLTGGLGWVMLRPPEPESSGWTGFVDATPLENTHIYIHICIHMYVFMYVCIYVCMYVCMYACMHASMNVCM